MYGDLNEEFDEEYMKLMIVCGTIAQSLEREDDSMVLVKNPRYDVFIRNGQILMPYLTFEEFVTGPGRWLSSVRHGESYGEWVLGFRAITSILATNFEVEVEIIRASALTYGRYDEEAILDDDAVEAAPDLITTLHHQSKDAASRTARALVLTAYQSVALDVNTCAVAIAHDENGIIEQRNYYPTTVEGLDAALDEAVAWAVDLGLDISVVELDTPETCGCCGELCGRTLDAIRQAAVQREIATPIGRNEPCVCGSGLKYKRCCGS
jgi:hypothetical protein